MKKKIVLLSSIVIFTMAIALTFIQKSSAIESSSLLLENIEALAAGETGSGTGKWFVTYNPLGHDCYGMGSWCCPGSDC